MRIEFVNHSSFIVESPPVRLLSDFWKDGAAFDGGWSLLSDTQFGYDDFARVTHLWFSHEHPDHFSPQNLKQIPEELRCRIEVLFQETADKRLVSFCRKLGFKSVTELAPGRSVALAPEFVVRCVPFGSDWGEVDSWLFVETPGGTLLNLNDCEVHDAATAERVRAACPKGVDVLATQFSYASKQGNAGDDQWIRRSRDYHKAKLELQIGVIRPKYVLPFASFVYFSHRENRYLNAGMIRVHEAAELIQRQAVPIVMAPGQAWTVGQSWHNQEALERYREDYDRVANKPLAEFATSDPVDAERLMRAAKERVGAMLQRASRRQVSEFLALKQAALRPNSEHGALRRRTASFLRGVKAEYSPARIYVKDQEQAYAFSLDGLEPRDWVLEECHIALSSSALHHCFAVAFGGETLQVNGRFDDIDGGWEMVREFFFLARRLEQGLRLPRSVLLGTVWHRLGFCAQPVGTLLPPPAATR